MQLLQGKEDRDRLAERVDLFEIVTNNSRSQPYSDYREKTLREGRENIEAVRRQPLLQKLADEVEEDAKQRRLANEPIF